MSSPTSSSSRPPPLAHQGLNQDFSILQAQFDELTKNAPHGGKSPEQVELVNGVLRKVMQVDMSFDPHVCRTLKREFDRIAQEEQDVANVVDGLNRVVLQGERRLPNPTTPHEPPRLTPLLPRSTNYPTDAQVKSEINKRLARGDVSYLR